MLSRPLLSACGGLSVEEQCDVSTRACILRATFGDVGVQRTTCDEWIGPGTYDPPGPYIGTENIHTGSATGMFDRYVRPE
eukprot:9503940-Pyramimonas_sp.AAC.1